MIAAIFLVILAITIAALLLLARKTSRPTDRQWLRIGAATAAVVFVIVLFFSTFTLVKAVEVGVPVTFGKVSKPIGPGVHFTAPWTDVETYPTRPLNVDVKAEVRTADAGKVSITTTGRWNVSVLNARELYFQVRTGDEDRIGREVVSRNLAQAIGDVYNNVSNVDATKRAGRAEAIKARLEVLLSPYGIDVAAIQLREVEPDPTTAQSIADFAAQQRKTKIATEANQTATADAIRRLTEANGIKNAAAKLSGINSVAAQLFCVQEWSNAVNAGRVLYTNPCTGTGAAPIVTVK